MVTAASTLRSKGEIRQYPMPAFSMPARTGVAAGSNGRVAGTRAVLGWQSVPDVVTKRWSWLDLLGVVLVLRVPTAG